MIALVVTLILALTWLGYETDWMQVRLSIGVIEVVSNGYKFKSWNELKPYNPNFRSYPMWLTHPDNMTPLCGLDWLENTMHIIPECRIELNHSGVKYNMTIKEPAIIKSVVSALRAKPARPYPKISYSRNKNGGMRFSPMIPRAV